jgi:hypothetical protein
MLGSFDNPSIHKRDHIPSSFILLVSMPDILKKRKIAVLGSRSVGELV